MTFNAGIEAAALKPCPFCKCRCVTATVNEHGWKVVQCDDCGAEGPCIDLVGDQYIDRWNTRPSSSAPVDPIELACVLIEAAAQVKRPEGATAHQAFFSLDVEDQEKWLRTANAALHWWGNAISAANRTN